MKKLLLALLLGMCTTTYVKAQVTAAEPEFSEETLLLTSDSEGVILERERLHQNKSWSKLVFDGDR